MQALGAYAGGRMLFLGLGTGLGSALIAEGVLMPLEKMSCSDTNDPRVVNPLGCDRDAVRCLHDLQDVIEGRRRHERRRCERRIPVHVPGALDDQAA
jgi:hypothetical protein